MKLGMKRGIVELYPHDSEWEKVARETMARIQNIIGSIVLGVEHIGSTAITNISAKPIIDLAVGLADIWDIKQYIQILEKEGIIFRGEETPTQLLFVIGDFEKDTRTHHIHIVNYEQDEWENYLNFRDYLNAFPEKAKEYEREKIELQAQFKDNRNLYTKGKNEIITRLLAEAREFRKQ